MTSFIFRRFVNLSKLNLRTCINSLKLQLYHLTYPDCDLLCEVWQYMQFYFTRGLGSFSQTSAICWLHSQDSWFTNYPSLAVLMMVCAFVSDSSLLLISLCVKLSAKVKGVWMDKISEPKTVALSEIQSSSKYGSHTIFIFKLSNIVLSLFPIFP